MNWRGDGMRSWLLQRVSAIFIALFAFYLGYILVLHTPVDYAQWHDWVDHPVNKVLISLFFIALFIHAWVGIRDVVLDYVHPVVLRFLVLTFIISGLITMGVWLLLIIVGV